MTTLRILAVAAIAEQVVERASASSAPVAFRIWKAGDNRTDFGVHKFTESSAKLIAHDQTARGNLYSIDCDHMSLNSASPPEARKAVGWHKLDVRATADGPELWATDVEWTDAVRAGLEKTPPEWRYFSPAYDVDKETSEITAYLNTALTNNPATWSVTALASIGTRRGKPSMTNKEILAALMGSDEAAKSAATAELLAHPKVARAIQAAFPEEGEKGEDGEDGEDGDKGEDGEKGEKGDDGKDKAAKTAELPEPKKEKEDDEKIASIAATSKLATLVTTLSRRVETLEAEKVAGARDTVLASRADLPKELVATLRDMPIDLMKKTIASIPVFKPDPAAAAKVTATRSAKGAEDRPAQLPPDQHTALRRRMGLEASEGGVRREGTALVFSVMPKAQTKRADGATGGK